MKNKILKIIKIVLGLLALMSLCYLAGYYIGKNIIIELIIS